MSATPGSANHQRSINTPSGALKPQVGASTISVNSTATVSSSNTPHGRSIVAHGPISGQKVATTPGSRTSSGMIAVPPLSAAKRSIYGSTPIATSGATAEVLSTPTAVSSAASPHTPISSTPIATTVRGSGIAQTSSSGPSHRTSAPYHPSTTPSTAHISAHQTATKPLSAAAAVVANAKTPLQVPKPASSHLISDAQWAEMNFSEAVNFSDFSMLAPTGSVASSGLASNSASTASSSGAGTSFGLSNTAASDLVSPENPKKAATTSFPSIFEMVAGPPPQSVLASSQAAPAQASVPNTSHQAPNLHKITNAQPQRTNSISVPPARSMPATASLLPAASSPTSSFIAVAPTKPNSPTVAVQPATKATASVAAQASPNIFPDEMDVDFEALYLAAVAEAEAFKRKAETEKSALVQAMATQEQAFKAMKEEEAMYKQQAEAWKEKERETTEALNVAPRAAPSGAEATSSSSAASSKLQSELEQARLELERKSRDIERLKSQLVSAHMEGIVSADEERQEAHMGLANPGFANGSAVTPTNIKKRNHDLISKTSSPAVLSPSHGTLPGSNSPSTSLSSTTVKARRIYEDRTAKKRKLVESFPFLSNDSEGGIVELESMNSFIDTQDLVMNAETPATERAKSAGSLCHLDSASITLMGGQHALQLVSQLLSEPQGPLIWLQSHQSRFITNESVQISFYALQSTIAAFQTKKESILMKIQSLLSNPNPVETTEASAHETAFIGSPYRHVLDGDPAKSSFSTRTTPEEHERLLISGLILQLVFATFTFICRLVNAIHQREMSLSEDNEGLEGIPISETVAVGASDLQSARALESTPSYTSTSRIPNAGAQVQGSGGRSNLHTPRTTTAVSSNLSGSTASQMRQLPTKSGSTSSVHNSTAQNGAIQGSNGPLANSRPTFPVSAPVPSTPTGATVTHQSAQLMLTENDRAAITHAMWLLTALLAYDPISRALAVLPLPLPNGPIVADRKTSSPASKRETNVMSMLRSIISPNAAPSPHNPSYTSILQFLAAELDLLVFSTPLDADSSNSSSPSASGFPTHAPLPLTPSSTMNTFPNMLRGANSTARVLPNNTNATSTALPSTAIPSTFTGPTSTAMPTSTQLPTAGYQAPISRETTKPLIHPSSSLSNASSSALILLEASLNLLATLLSDADAILSPYNPKNEKTSSITTWTPQGYLFPILARVHGIESGVGAVNSALVFEEGQKSAFKAISSIFDSEAFVQSLSPYSKSSASSSTIQTNPSYLLPQIAHSAWKLLQQFSTYQGTHPSFNVHLERVISNIKQLLIVSPPSYEGGKAMELEERRIEWLIGNPTLSGFSHTPSVYQPSLSNNMNIQVQQMDTRLLMVRCMQTFATRKRDLFQKALAATSNNHLNANSTFIQPKAPLTASTAQHAPISAAHASISKSSHRWENPFPQTSETSGNHDVNGGKGDSRSGTSIDLGSQLATSLVIAVSKATENMVKIVLLYDSLEHTTASEWNSGSNMKIDFWNHPLPIVSPGAPSSALVGDKMMTLSSIFNMKGAEETLGCIEDGESLIFGKTAICDRSAIVATSHANQYPLLISTMNFILEACDLILLILRNLPRCAIILRSSEPELWSSFRILDSLNNVSALYQLPSSDLSMMTNGDSATWIQIASPASSFVHFSKFKLSQCLSRLNSILENLATLQGQTVMR